LVESGSSTAGALTRLIALTLVLLAAVNVSLLEAAPDGARMFRHVIALAQDIGPRKTGSEADRRAVDYVRDSLDSYGLDVSLQEVPGIEEAEGEHLVGSWNVIGRLEGDGPDTLIVAAHHDTRSGVVPGANDDASGVAVMLEVARLTAARPRRTHYLFISFCGEEDGLYGSKYFTRNIDLSRVRAMIALELLGREEILVGPVPRQPEYWAQRAFVNAARKSGVRSLAARPLWTIVPRLVDLPHTADHEPFLDAGVPSMLLLGTYPAWTYHTPEDTVRGIRPRAMRRAAAVLDHLLLDLEESPPSRLADPHYLPVTVFGFGLVIPTTALLGVGLLALVGAAFLVMRHLRAVLSPRQIFETMRVLLVGGTATALGLSGLFGSEKLMELIHGVDRPWSAYHGLHVAQAIAGMVVTGWMGLNLFRRIKPTIEPGPYLAGALLLPVAGVLAALTSGWPELAALPAVPVLAIGLSLLVDSIARKLALGLLGVVPLAFLITLRDYRAVVELGGVDVPDWILFCALGACVLPFVLFLAHVASFQDCLHSRVWWRLSGPWIGGPAFVAWLVLGIASALLPAYDDEHRQVVHLRQLVDLETETATATLDSSDVMDGVRLGKDQRAAPGSGVMSAELDVTYPEGSFDFMAESVLEPLDEEIAVTSTTRFTAPVDAHSVTYRFNSESGFTVPGRGPALRHAYTFDEMTNQPDPERQFRLLLPPGGDLEVTLTASFQEDLLGLNPSGAGRTFVHQATVTASRHLVGRQVREAAEGSMESDPATID
jgi:hypothetical protein